MPKLSYTLNRSGEFSVTTTGATHCGTTNPLTIRYRLIARCPASSLDSRGFLFDQVEVDRWFQAQRETSLSCEQYAAHCARELYRLIRRENAGIEATYLSLELSPAPFAAAITFVYDATEADTKAASITTRPVATFMPEQRGLDLFYGGMIQ